MSTLRGQPIVDGEVIVVSSIPSPIPASVPPPSHNQNHVSVISVGGEASVVKDSSSEASNGGVIVLRTRTRSLSENENELPVR